MRGMVVMVALALALGPLTVLAEERFGVPIYPGAKKDAVADAYCTTFNTESLQQARGQQVSEAACFRTGDDFTKVVGYYQHERTVMPLGQPIDKGPQRSALFCLQGMKSASLGNGVDVMISTPWTDGKQWYQDVMISIRKAARK